MSAWIRINNVIWTKAQLESLERFQQRIAAEGVMSQTAVALIVAGVCRAVD